MNPETNPFAPGAGTRPPELAGREEIIEGARVALARVKRGRPARSQMLLGLRGVGKTVLLNRFGQLAHEEGYLTVSLEAPEDRRLAEMLVPPLRSLLLHLSRTTKAKDMAIRGLSVLRAFASAFKVSVGDIEFGVAPASGNADSGVLELDLPQMLEATAEAAQVAQIGVAIFVDEVQYLTTEDFSALIVALHKCNQKGLPIICFGAGLPQLAALAGNAKSYAERLFEYPEVGKLPPDAARSAIRTPVQREGAEITEGALDVIIRDTNGYPYFLQEWGSKTWDVAPDSPIATRDAKHGAAEALRQLDQGFFKVRLDRLTSREKEYARAMAQLGAGPYKSGDVAALLNIDVSTAAPIRRGLIKKGMVYSLQHGEAAFTVPMFDQFLRRSIPDWK